MNLWLRLAWRQMRGSRSFVTIYVFNLAVGLSGFLALDLYKNSFESFFIERSKALLTADFAVSSRRPLAESEKQILDKELTGKADRVEQLRLLSMVAGPSRSRLASIVASGPAFPFFGEFELAGGSRRSNTNELSDDKNIWIYPELATELQVKAGDTLRIGESTFLIKAIIKDDPTGSSGAFEFAPRVYMGLHHLQATGLIQKGSRIEYRTYLKQLPNARNPIGKKALETALAAPEIRILTPTEAAEQVGRAFGYLTDYLSLVALVGLFIVGIANTFLFRGFIRERQSDIGVMRIVGATGREAQELFLWQVVLLGLAAGILAIGCAALLTYGLHLSIAALLPKEFSFSIPWARMPLLLVGILLVSFLASLPAVRSAGLIRPLILLRPSPNNDAPQPEKLWFAPAGLGFLTLAVAAANSLKVGLIFFLGLASCAALATITGLLYGIGLKRLGVQMRTLSLKLAVRNTVRAPTSALAGFVTMVIVTSLLTLVPQLKQILLSDLKGSSSTPTPSLFLFDIQPEQVAEVSRQFAAENIILDPPSPMIVSRLTEINGKPHERAGSSEDQSREEEESRSTKNRTYNLSYRHTLSSSESIVKGTFNPYRPPGSLPAISLEQRFAERMGITLGAQMTFDVQGVALSGEVTSLRRVRWRSFEPNFFVQFQPGPLDEAPRTYVAAVRSPAEESKEKAQEILSSNFANISVVDVSRTIGRIEGVIGQIAKVIAFVAIICAIGGGFVIFALANYQANLRGWELNLLRILGCDLLTLTRSLSLEFLLVSGSGAVLGSGIGVGLVWLLNHFIFEAPFALDVPALVVVLTSILVLTQAIGLAAFLGRLRDQPANILREAG